MKNNTQKVVYGFWLNVYAWIEESTMGERMKCVYDEQIDL